MLQVTYITKVFVQNNYSEEEISITFMSNDLLWLCEYARFHTFVYLDRNDVYENMEAKYKILQQKDDQVMCTMFTTSRFWIWLDIN